MTVKFERKSAQLGAGTLEYYVGGEADTDDEGAPRLPLDLEREFLIERAARLRDTGEPHTLNAPFALDRFHSGRLVDEHGAAGVAH